jgi:hypothetical protein
MVLGQAGQMAEPYGPEDVRSVVNPAGKLFFGRMAVIDNTSEGKAAHPSATGQKPLGVVMHSHATVSKEDGLDAGYATKETANVLRKGYIWVVIEETVAIGDAVFFRHTAGGGGTKLGAFRNDADTATADAITNARWVKGGTQAEGIALLELGIL